jgi:hypothetical protein
MRVVRRATAVACLLSYGDPGLDHLTELDLAEIRRHQGAAWNPS